jgi:hypothetical protein
MIDIHICSIHSLAMWEFQRTRCFISSLPRARRIRYDIELVRTGFLKSGGPKETMTEPRLGSTATDTQFSGQTVARPWSCTIFSAFPQHGSNDRPLHVSEVESASHSAATFSASVICQMAKREATVHEENHTIGDSISTLEYTTENRSILPDGPLPTRVKAPVTANIVFDSGRPYLLLSAA